MKRERTTFLAKFYMWLIVLLPVLAQYKVGPLDLDTVLMIVFFLCALVSRNYLWGTRLNGKALVIFLYIVVTTVVNILWGQKFSPTADIVLRSGRYCLYIIIVFFLGNEYVRYEQIMKIYRIVAYAATIYVIIQTIAFYGAGITLPNKIGATVNDATAEVGRLRSFYSEPAVMSYSLVAFIACSLFGKPYGKKTANASLDAIFVSTGIILSTSGQGIVATGVIWVLWVLDGLIKRKLKFKQLCMLMGAVIVVVVLYNSGILKYALDRAGNTNEGGAVDARMSGYESLALLSGLQKIFGSGFGNYVVENVFGLDVVYEFVNYSSLAEFLFTLGIVGTALWVLLFITLFKKGPVCTKVLIAAMTVLAFGGCPLSGLFMPLWLTLMSIQLPKGYFATEQLQASAAEMTQDMKARV